MARKQPENKVKTAVKEILAAYEPWVYGHWPVPWMMGGMLDYHGSCCGLYFTIECKRDELHDPTPRQLITRRAVEASLAKAFLVRTQTGEDIQGLDAWLHTTVMAHKAKMHHAHQRQTR